LFYAVRWTYNSAVKLLNATRGTIDQFDTGIDLREHMFNGPWLQGIWTCYAERNPGFVSKPEEPKD
jgi:hypothetical protein